MIFSFNADQIQQLKDLLNDADIDYHFFEVLCSCGHFTTTKSSVMHHLRTAASHLWQAFYQEPEWQRTARRIMESNFISVPEVLGAVNGILSQKAFEALKVCPWPEKMTERVLTRRKDTHVLVPVTEKYRQVSELKFNGKSLALNMNGTRRPEQYNGDTNFRPGWYLVRKDSYHSVEELEADSDDEAVFDQFNPLLFVVEAMAFIRQTNLFKGETLLLDVVIGAHSTKISCQFDYPKNGVVVTEIQDGQKKGAFFVPSYWSIM